MTPLEELNTKVRQAFELLAKAQQLLADVIALAAQIEAGQ